MAHVLCVVTVMFISYCFYNKECIFAFWKGEIQSVWKKYTTILKCSYLIKYQLCSLKKILDFRSTFYKDVIIQDNTINNNLCSFKVHVTISYFYHYHTLACFVLMLHKLLGVWRWRCRPAGACWSGTSEAAPSRTGCSHRSSWGRVYQEYHKSRRTWRTSPNVEGKVWKVR